ncbi:hypothetical protein CAEBREN_06217 [Caenorhabditis brenneri]|uniref:N-acetyltransferase domain-containing protein n=1 Tax=Caenorhabditis brenneri TaxID=135651 RepID=G0N488_CAEBE|nr:hypothetical protein CAEBREN_06217 [Caenorhabditis brenneri]
MEDKRFSSESPAPVQFAVDSAIETSATTATEEVRALTEQVHIMDLEQNVCKPNNEKLIQEQSSNNTSNGRLATLEFPIAHVSVLASNSRSVATSASVVDGHNLSVQQSETAELAPPKQESMSSKTRNKNKKMKEKASEENRIYVNPDCYELPSSVVVLKEVNAENIQVLLQVTDQIFCGLYIGKYIKQIQEARRFRCFRLAYLNDVAIGVVTLFPHVNNNTLCIKSFGIIRGYRGNGFADSLMQFVWSVKDAIGAQTVSVDMPIRFYQGIQYFEKRGFVLQAVDTDCESTMLRCPVYRFDSI